MKKVYNAFNILFQYKVINVSVLWSLLTPASLNQTHFSLSWLGVILGCVTSGLYHNKQGAVLKQP